MFIKIGKVDPHFYDARALKGIAVNSALHLASNTIKNKCKR